MTINYKDKFYIYHPDGKFTEEQLMKILDAAYNMGKKDGYSEGYEVGKNSTFSITYPYTEPNWWKSPWYTTTSRTDKISITPTSITTATNANTNPSSITTTTVTNNTCREFKYDGTER